jgi:hypothetical protein
MLWHFAYGKPKETVDVTTTMDLPDPRTLSTSELEDTILQHAAEIRAQRDAKKAGSARGPEVSGHHDVLRGAESLPAIGVGRLQFPVTIGPSGQSP